MPGFHKDLANRTVGICGGSSNHHRLQQPPSHLEFLGILPKYSESHLWFASKLTRSTFHAAAPRQPREVVRDTGSRPPGTDFVSYAVI